MCVCVCVCVITYPRSTEAQLAADLVDHFLRTNGPSDADADAIAAAAAAGVAEEWRRSTLAAAAAAAAARIAVLTPYRCLPLPPQHARVPLTSPSRAPHVPTLIPHTGPRVPPPPRPPSYLRRHCAHAGPSVRHVRPLRLGLRSSRAPSSPQPPIRRPPPPRPLRTPRPLRRVRAGTGRRLGCAAQD